MKFKESSQWYSQTPKKLMEMKEMQILVVRIKAMIVLTWEFSKSWKSKVRQVVKIQMT